MDIVDLLLAILHHFLVFTLAGMLAAEFVLVRPGLSGASLGVLGRIDGAYGGVAMAIIVVGICRVLFGLKGWEYYVTNHAFWGKMAAFVIVGLLSIRPTMRIIAWRQSGTGVVPEGRDPGRPLLDQGRDLLPGAGAGLRRRNGARHRLLNRCRLSSRLGDRVRPISTSGAGTLFVFTAALQMSAITQRSHSGLRALHT